MTNNDYLEMRVREIMNLYNIDRIIAHDEYDLIRVGKIRDYYGIEGQSELSARMFRDKVFMKETASKTVDVPKFKRIESIFDVIEFVESNNYPFIIKPVDQGARA
ncbi:hypothetical protein [Shouchella miscanthi]|uniref:ATP-grasp domain-containing protein n=1 Tax=Shouchella miscanthi TaxID=2598861 RepID=A0ABU6NRT8_9BACI|nr:hypothetical protein [Shouchella miscanthi]